jgi:hypothetical protein
MLNYLNKKSFHCFKLSKIDFFFWNLNWISFELVVENKYESFAKKEISSLVKVIYIQSWKSLIIFSELQFIWIKNKEFNDI